MDVDLLGPTKWWPKNYNYKWYSFEIPNINNKHKEAFAMIYVNNKLERYAFVFLTNDNL